MAVNSGYGLNYQMYRGLSPTAVATHNNGYVPEGFDWSQYQAVQTPESGWGAGSNIQSAIQDATTYTDRMTAQNAAAFNGGSGFVPQAPQQTAMGMTQTSPVQVPGLPPAPTGTVTYPSTPPRSMPATPAAPAGMMAPRYMTGTAATGYPKDGSNPPSAPDFMGAAGAQGAENYAAAGRQARINNPNFYGVGGSQTVSYGPDGTPTVTQNLSPEQRALYNADIANRTSAANVARGMFGIGGMGGEFDLSGAPAMPGDYESTRNSVIQAMMRRTNQDLARREDQTNSDLIARGIRPGTKAYAEEMARIDRARNDASSQAEITAGDAVEQAMRADLARRTQGVNEATLSRTLPFSEYQALSRAGGFEMPDMPGYAQNNQVAPAPIFGATTAASNYDVDVWNALMQQENSRNTGLLGLGQTALNGLLNSNSGNGLLSRIVGGLFRGGA